MALINFTVCLLHPREAAAFEHHGIEPACKTGGKFFHAHIPMHEADQREKDSFGVYLDSAKRYMRAIPSRVWQPTGPARMRSLQLVTGCVRGRAGQFHTKAVPLGAQGRNTSVRATNYVPKELEDVRVSVRPI